jgi:hypothetical protein
MVFGVIALVVLTTAFELLSPTLAERQAHDAASDVAYGAAHVLFTERDSHKLFKDISLEARKAAETHAQADGVTLTMFDIDTAQVVHVTIVKEARSFVVKRISSLKKFDEITVSATAAPS